MVSHLLHLPSPEGLPLPFGCFYPKNFRPGSLFFDAHLEGAFPVQMFEFWTAVGEGLSSPSNKETIQPQLGMSVCFKPLERLQSGIEM